MVCNANFVTREFKITPQVVNLTLVPAGYLGLPFRLWLKKKKIHNFNKTLD